MRSPALGGLVTRGGTTEGRRVYGPGPVSETFPGALRPLEQDLWLPPLRDGLRHALLLAGAATRRQLDASPLLVVVGGHAAVDLSILGPGRRSVASLLDPRPGARRLASAWRVGRLRIALPRLAADLVEQADADLAAVPHLSRGDDRTLLTLLHGGRRLLRCLHGHEILAGLLDGEPPGRSAAGIALERLQHARARGLQDDWAAAAHPVVLSLSAPRIGERALALTALADSHTHPRGRPEELALRELLRLRIRWTHELGARAAAELGERLARRGAVDEPADVALLSLGDLTAAVSGTGPFSVDRSGWCAGPALPRRFHLHPDGTPVPIQDARRREPGPGCERGTPGAPGRAEGVTALADPHTLPPPGVVLVTAQLDPRLASQLPLVAAVIAEDGGPMSHVAIVAREVGVPVVCGITDATRRWPPGTPLIVDGDLGEVRVGAEVAV